MFLPPESTGHINHHATSASASHKRRLRPPYIYPHTPLGHVSPSARRAESEGFYCRHVIPGQSPSHRLLRSFLSPPRHRRPRPIAPPTSQVSTAATSSPVSPIAGQLITPPIRYVSTAPTPPPHYTYCRSSLSTRKHVGSSKSQ